MPAEGIHITAFREAAFSARMPIEARRAALRFEDVGRLGAIVPDLPYFDHYAEEVVRYALALPPRASPLGAIVHDGAAPRIVYALAAEARRARSLEVAALALGAGSHAAIDRALHPLINALARRFAEGRPHDVAHREVEKLQSICFHEAYFAKDRMGTDGIVRLVRVPFTELFSNPTIASALTRAYQAAIEEPAMKPTGADLSRMGRGYEQHTKLLGSPLGKLLAPEPAKAAGRPKFLQGAWGRFDSILERAIDLSVEVLERVWEACTASDREEEDRTRALRAALAPGSIDSMGEDIDLAVPFAHSAPSRP